MSITMTNLKDIMSRTLGAFGIFINKEFAKNVIRRRASKFWGTFMADSLTVKSKWSLITYIQKKLRLISNSLFEQNYELYLLECGCQNYLLHHWFLVCKRSVNVNKPLPSLYTIILRCLQNSGESKTKPISLSVIYYRA